MSTIVGLDPSIRSPGLAVIRDGVLVAALRVKLSAATLAIEDHGERVKAVAAEIAYWIRNNVGHDPEGVTLVYEWPQIYGPGKSTGDPKDLIALAAIGASVEGRLASTFDKIITPKPRQWTAGTSKNTKGPAWDCTRGRRLQAILTPAEFALVPAQHDAIDAACLALFPTGRALHVPRRVKTRGGPRASPSASPVRP